jgi:hypothetical protein
MLPLDQVTDDLKFDAIVIGSGAGGGKLREINKIELGKK